MRWAVVMLFALACSKSADKAPPKDPDRPPPMTVEEMTRNTDACTAYAAQICACATAHPDKTLVVERCNADRGLPDALSLVTTGARNTEAAPTDVLIFQTKARKIATECMDQLAKLPSLGCP